ncbi:hypothetical protein Bbelb_093440 [Branchiostoma belcheri]|nr:hypothetical protein Bbelb_093440 [Branchiostoma belcheri]
MKMRLLANSASVLAPALKQAWAADCGEKRRRARDGQPPDDGSDVDAIGQSNRASAGQSTHDNIIPDFQRAALLASDRDDERTTTSHSVTPTLPNFQEICFTGIRPGRRTHDNITLHASVSPRSHGNDSQRENMNFPRWQRRRADIYAFLMALSARAASWSSVRRTGCGIMPQQTRLTAALTTGPADGRCDDVRNSHGQASPPVGHFLNPGTQFVLMTADGKNQCRRRPGITQSLPFEFIDRRVSISRVRSADMMNIARDSSPDYSGRDDPCCCAEDARSPETMCMHSVCDAACSPSLTAPIFDPAETSLLAEATTSDSTTTIPPPPPSCRQMAAMTHLPPNPAAHYPVLITRGPLPRADYPVRVFSRPPPSRLSPVPCPPPPSCRQTAAVTHLLPNPAAHYPALITRYVSSAARPADIRPSSIRFAVVIGPDLRGKTRCHGDGRSCPGPTRRTCALPSVIRDIVRVNPALEPGDHGKD